MNTLSMHHLALLPPRKSRRIFCFAPSIPICVLLILLVPPNVFGQAFTPPPDPVDIVWGWDFTGIPVEERPSLMSILDPLSFKNEPTSPEEVELREYYRLAITNPDAFAANYPKVLSPEEKAQTEIASYAILNPVEWQKALDAVKSKEQLEAEATSLWFMTHPQELEALAAQLKTPEEKQAEEEARKAVRNPHPRPKAVLIPTEPEPKLPLPITPGE